MASGFGFGAKTTAPPAFGTGSITFGTAAPQPASQFGSLGAPAAPSTGFQFASATPSTTPSLFGAPANAAKQPAFGIATTATAALGGFGAPSTALGGTPSLFGTQAVSTATTGFGAAVSSAPPSFGFGTPASTVQAGTGLSFGAQPVSTPSTGLTFGTPAASTGLSFGAPSTASTALGFGAPTTSAPGLSFGAAPTTTSAIGLSFGTTPAKTTAGLSFGSTTTSSAAPTLNFGTSAASASTGLFGGLAATAPTTAAIGLSFGLGGTPPTTTSASLNLVTATTSAPVNVGLGGIATTQAKTTVTTQKEVPPKDQPLPNEISQTVEQFKEMVKQQKMYSSDIARCSVRDFRKVEQEIDVLNKVINEVEIQLQKNRSLAEKLKYDTAKNLQHVEMAQRTQDTPPGLQYENTAPLKYFLDLADHFEREMHSLKLQIEVADKFVKNHKNPNSLTSQDLTLGMRRLHDTFVALAGRLQSVHTQVESQKESYINLRRQVYNDYSNPFEKVIRPLGMPDTTLNRKVIYSPPKVASGPTPFSNLALGNVSFAMQAAQPQNQPPPAYPGTGGTSSTTGFNITTPPAFGQQVPIQQTNTLFGSQSFNQPSSFLSTNTSSNFQLQKPPTGTKRGKV